jgi:hypothetical protein
MVKREFTTEMIAAGRQLLELLDRHKFPACAAFWFYFDESACWRFVVASPEVRTGGSIAAYRKIRALVRKIPGANEVFGPSNLTALEDDDRLIVALRRANSRGPKLAGRRLTGEAINGTMIDDAYIYRVK